MLGAVYLGQTQLGELPLLSVAYLLNLADSVTISALEHLVLALAKADSVTESDTTIKAVGLNKSDTETPSDANAKSVTSPHSDSSTPSDANSKVVTTPKSDSVTASDASVKTYGANKTDSTTISDSTAKSVVASKSDSLLTIDGLSKAVAKVLADSATTADSSRRAIGLGKSDNVTASDQFSRLISFIRMITDIAISDDESDQISISGTNLNDDVDTFDSIALVLGKYLSDSSTITDVSVRNIGASRNDAVTAVDSKRFQIGLAKSDSVTSLDSESNITSYNRNLNDQISAIDSSTNIVSYLRSMADSIVSSDVESNHTGKLFADSTATSDATQKSLAKNLTEIAQAVDNFTKIAGYALHFSDVVTGVDHSRILLNGIIRWYLDVVVNYEAGIDPEYFDRNGGEFATVNTDGWYVPNPHPFDQLEIVDPFTKNDSSFAAADPTNDDFIANDPGFSSNANPKWYNKN